MIMNTEPFINKAPAQIVPTLLDQGRYYGSVRTFYRVLEENQQVRERRNQRRHPKYPAPTLIATGPNQVWTWDITLLPTLVRGVYLYLYVILDIYSRFAVGWTLDEKESSATAHRLIAGAAERHGIGPGQTTLHQDRGAPMKSKTLRHLLSDLDIAQSFSRPRTSDDNPFSESHFKTVKYHSDFPGNLRDLEHGRRWARRFFEDYHYHHRHSGIAYLTPWIVYSGRAEEVLSDRHETMMAAYNRHPERFIQGPPRRQTLPQVVGINLPSPKQQSLWEGREPIENQPSVNEPATASAPSTGLLIAQASPNMLTNSETQVSHSY